MASRAARDTVACRVLVVDDEASLRFALREVLAREGYEVECCKDGFEALAVLDEFAPHVAFVDYSMPKINGLELLGRLRRKAPELFVIMMTAYGTETLAVECMKAGAYDYFVKPFNNDEVLLVLGKARERLELVEENRKLREQVSGGGGRARIIGESPRLRQVLAVIEQVASTDVTVLVQGESGTGKELVASAIHYASRRCGRPFVKLNCAALPETLIESELFGYDAGAFTGAVQARKGRFEQADRGTIFLDEIGDMSLSTQTKVLRVLQEREFERLGGSKTFSVDVRVIAATHQDLEKLIKAGEFREDLYYRLNVVRIEVPPLRERVGDVELLANHFHAQQCLRFGKEVRTLPSEVIERMRVYPWPGNVRELENAVARAVVLEDLDSLVPDRSTAARSEFVGGLASLSNLSYKDAKKALVDQFERMYFAHMLDRADDNLTQAAKFAGMHRKNLWQKLQRLDLLPSGRRDDEEDEDE